MADMKGLRSYVSADSDLPASEVTTLSMLLDAAVEWWKNAGVIEPAEGSTLYDLGVYMLAASWYNSRGATAEIDFKAGPFGVYSIKHQLETFGGS